jgi:hypothetical protein
MTLRDSGAPSEQDVIKQASQGKPPGKPWDKLSGPLGPIHGAKHVLRVCIRAYFKISKSKQTVFKISSQKSSGIFRRSRRVLLPQARRSGSHHLLVG